MKNKSKQTQTGNITIIKDDFIKDYSLIHNNLLKDNRLTPAEKGILIMLLALPNNFKITTRATSNYLNISEPTFTKFLNNYKKLGYLKITRHLNNYNYEFTDISAQQIEFNLSSIKFYTLEQLNYFAHSKTIAPKYKNLINKALENLVKGDQEFNKFIEELEELKERAL